MTREEAEAAWKMRAQLAQVAIDLKIKHLWKASDTSGLSAASAMLAVIVGAQTSVLRAPHACADEGLIDRDAQFSALLREIANIWGQLNDEPHTGAVQ